MSLNTINCKGCGACCEILFPFCDKYDKKTRTCLDYDNRPWPCVRHDFISNECYDNVCLLARKLRDWRDETHDLALFYRVVGLLKKNMWGASEIEKEIILAKLVGIIDEDTLKNISNHKRTEIKKGEIMLLNNCLVGALHKTLGKSRESLARMFIEGGITIEDVKGVSIPFKKALKIVKSNGLSLDDISVVKNPDGVYHAKLGTGISISAVEPEEGDYIGEPMSTAMAIMYGSGIAAGGSILGGLLGGGEAGLSYTLPDFYEDPYYGKVQESLYPFASDILSGNINEYYRPLGEIGGELFEDVLGRGTRDIQQAGLESAARLGKRGGNVASGISRNVADYTSKMRYDDYIRALTGRQNLLNMGLNTLGNVGSSALNYQSQRNAYEVNKGNLALGYAGMAQQAQQAMGQGIGSAISGVGNLYALNSLLGNKYNSAYSSADYNRLMNYDLNTSLGNLSLGSAA